MNKDRVYEAFLAKQFEEGLALARRSDILKLSPMPGEPACRYVAHFDGGKGLVAQRDGQIVEFDQFVVGICFPEDYLRHVDIPNVLTYLGPHPSPFHPNIRPPFVCMHLAPGTGLVDILHACYELWTWHLFATSDEGLNHAASQWSRQQDRKRFPIDRRPLKRRMAQLAVMPSTAMEAK
jgi:hypothetical protein